VWICPWPHGHIQAVGTDAAGRRQYLYHDAWRVLRDRQKFERVVDFGRALPTLRTVVDADLRAESPTEERVLATVVRLLDLGFFRIGNEQYARDNETFGIATLRKEHVTVSRGELTFDYPAKGSIRRVVTISDAETFEVIRALKRRRGGSGNLFAYKHDGRWADLRADRINSYIREGAMGDFSAKDFRTWSGTVLGAVELARASSATPRLSRSARQRVVREAVKTVSEYLGNTPAVCRKSYIDPKLFDRFDAGETIAPAIQGLTGSEFADRTVREALEAAVIDLIGPHGTASGAAAA
jgi:DNA topoisomerase IB